MAENERRGCLAKVIVLIVFIAALRANLPPDNVAQSLDLSQYDNASGIKRLFGPLVARGLASELIADWEYTDLGIIKLAHSERLDLMAVGLPFCRWKVYG